MKLETYKNIKITVKLNSKQKKLIKIDQNEFIACIKAKPQKGKANIELIELLSEELKVAKNKIWIKSGIRSREKIIKIIS